MHPAAKNGMADAMPFFSPTRTASLGSRWKDCGNVLRRGFGIDPLPET